ncbi:MAG: methyltransferase domain-containing protein [Thermostichales cyanobacterium SZTDM-1c_bins_54]
MEEALYHRHFAVEDSHWWFQGRAAVVLSLLDRYCPVSVGESYLDVGCGTGLILKKLTERGQAVGVDMSPLAVDYAKQRGIKDVYCCPVQELPRDTWRFRVGLLLDVIEHVEDDLGLLKQVQQILQPEGQVLVTVPAYPWMWSQHDVLNHHYRRYSKAQLAQVLRESGFQIQKLTFYNTWLFLPALLQKALSGRRPIRDAAQTIPTVPPLLNSLFREIFASERWLLPYVHFPFGVSLLAIARKP